MNILITGGAGFIGSHIVDSYIGAGHNVTVVDNLSTGRTENLKPGARFFKCDLRDRSSLMEIFASDPIDAISHHAAQTDVRRSVADPANDASVNILGLINLLECAVHNQVGRVIFASTGGAIYGEQDYFPADEVHPTRPIAPYGVSKLSSEAYLFYYSAIYGIDVVVLRYANVYGPRQNPHGEAGVAAIFTNNMLSEVQSRINGDGMQTRDYVYVSDVVSANIAALDQRGFQIFNVGTGRETDVNRIFSLIKEYSGSELEAVHGPAKNGEQKRSVLNAGKITTQLGWTPRVTLEEGLEKTVAWFMSRSGMGLPLNMSA